MYTYFVSTNACIWLHVVQYCSWKYVSLLSVVVICLLIMCNLIFKVQRCCRKCALELFIDFLIQRQIWNIHVTYALRFIFKVIWLWLNALFGFFKHTVFKFRIFKKAWQQIQMSKKNFSTLKRNSVCRPFLKCNVMNWLFSV